MTRVAHQAGFTLSHGLDFSPILSWTLWCLGIRFWLCSFQDNIRIDSPYVTVFFNFPSSHGLWRSCVFILWYDKKTEWFVWWDLILTAYLYNQPTIEYETSWHVTYVFIWFNIHLLPDRMTLTKQVIYIPSVHSYDKIYTCTYINEWIARTLCNRLAEINSIMNWRTIDKSS